MEEKFKTFQTEILTMIESGDITVGPLGLSEESADFIQKFDDYKQDLISEVESVDIEQNRELYGTDFAAGMEKMKNIIIKSL